MGRINSSTRTIIHLSHPHPLNLINHQQTLTPTIPSSCSACNLNLSGMVYSCTPCNFFLHQKCFEMPQNITHISHPHKLDLTFEPPYDTKDFCCDICNLNGSHHWLYRCNFCGFDAHLNCAASVSQAQSQMSSTSRSAIQPPAGLGHMSNAAAGVPMELGPFMGPFGVGGQNNDMAMQAAFQMINNTNTMAQALLTAGNERAQQQIMQFTAGLNNGGGGVPGMNAIGGGGQNVLQAALMNGGGGGGGMDLLQSLMGGGNGGGGGLAGSGVLNLLGGAFGSLL